MSAPRWRGLSEARAQGHACVICGRDYLHSRGRPPMRWVPVGRSMSTGSQVFACVTGCAERAVARCYRGGVGVLSDEVLTVAGAAFLRAWDAATLASPTGDPRHAHPDDIVVATVAAAAPPLIATELRHLADVFEAHLRTWPRVATTGDTEWRSAWRECAAILRERASWMDPGGGV